MHVQLKSRVKYNYHIKLTKTQQQNILLFHDVSSMKLPFLMSWDRR